MTAWTGPADVRAKARRRWDDGSVLRALAAGQPFPVIEVALRGPRPAEIGDDLDGVRLWIAGLAAGSRSGSRYTLQYKEIGGRLFGRNEVPSRAFVGTYEQLGALLGVTEKMREYRAVLAGVSGEPAVAAWVADNPLRALEVAGSWPQLLAAYRWLSDARGSGRYLREITAPGVDTKFVERHRPLLAQLLGVTSSGPGFLSGLGFASKPETVRVRIDRSLGFAAGLSDLTVRVDELVVTEVAVERALIVENEVTFLSVPVPPKGILLWGKGFEVDRVGSMPWLKPADVVYWGDLDTHGFAILDRLRAWLPQTRSVLMDRDTLLVHRDRWVTEPLPTAARLQHLTANEEALYQDLVADRFGERVRLEQERIDWAWATERLLTPRVPDTDLTTR